MVQQAFWLADYYFCGVGEALSLMVPKGVRTTKNSAQITPDGPNQPLDRGSELADLLNKLTDMQSDILKNILTDMDDGKDKFYLYGVTGSGKTEVYMHLIKRLLDNGKSVILMVPEIGLSYQLFDRISGVFQERCRLVHSGLSTTRRFTEYEKILNGGPCVVVGTRSAVFSPAVNLGLIIIDEEHESTYKSEERPRFHARTVALKICSDRGASVLFGSATPSVESWFYSLKGYFKYYSLNQRFGDAHLPEVRIVDFRGSGNNFISPLLRNEINNTLKAGSQVLLLQNRRGYSMNVTCNQCGYQFKCPRCDINLTFHRSKNKLLCHHCSFSSSVPEKCPECSSDKFYKPGAGTQRIEDLISKVFIGSSVIRVDLDSFTSDYSIKHAVEEINQGKYNIIIGTQMISKGFDFKNIKLVGVIDADISLNVPDYRSTERSFSLLTQVAGRSGRHGSRGLVIIQTTNPQHYSITSAINNDFEQFYRNEIGFRKMLNLPPFYRLARIVLRDRDEKKISETITAIHNELNLIKTRLGTQDILIEPPAPCVYLKNNLYYRYQIVLRYLNYAELNRVLLELDLTDRKYGNMKTEIDIEPNNLL